MVWLHEGLRRCIAASRFYSASGGRHNLRRPRLRGADLAAATQSLAATCRRR
jgi:hypothetical protein